MTRWFLDTEFNDNGRTIDLISLAVCSEDGREREWVSSEFDEAACGEWLRTSVFPHLSEKRVQRATIKHELRELVLGDGTRPEFWGYFSAYDWVAVCQLYGGLLSLPHGFPHFCRDLKQLMPHMGVIKAELPAQDGILHSALSDARWVREAVGYLEKKR
jgi:hypothetical protein